MVKIEVDNLKQLRESLCVAQSGIRHAKESNQTNYYQHHVQTIGDLINQIDELRPLGPDGKHGNRHTDHCGCDL